jgi:Inorganic pyrophosphatase
MHGGGDGDPLDVILLGCDSPAAGSLVAARAVGVLEAEVFKKKKNGRKRRSERNDRLVPVATESRRHRALRSVRELGDESRREMVEFFVDYSSRTGERFRARAAGSGLAGPPRSSARPATGMATPGRDPALALSTIIWPRLPTEAASGRTRAATPEQAAQSSRRRTPPRSCRGGPRLGSGVLPTRYRFPVKFSPAAKTSTLREIE